jgi:hypothetical protein
MSAPAVANPELPAVDPEVAALRAEINKRGKDIDALKKLVLVQPQPQVQQQQQPQQQVDMQALNKEFYKEPVRLAADIASAITERAKQEMRQEFSNASFDTLRQSARGMARAGNTVLFDRFAGEIEAEVAKTPTQYQTNASVWQSAMTFVKGMHADELVEEARKAPPTGNGGSAAVHISQQGGPQNGRPAGPPPAVEKLSDDERAVARKLGITDQQYIDGKKSIETQRKTGPSSWDSVVTTSTKEKRRREADAKKQRAGK